jgi:hypothetical protein
MVGMACMTKARLARLQTYINDYERCYEVCSYYMI